MVAEAKMVIPALFLRRFLVIYDYHSAMCPFQGTVNTSLISAELEKEF